MTDLHDILIRPLVVGFAADGSADSAVRLAYDLSARFGTPLEIVTTVTGSRFPMSGLSNDASEQVEEAQREGTRRAVESRLRELGPAPAQLGDIVRIDTDTPSRVLVRHARSIDAGAILVGHRQKRPVLELGSTVRALMSHAPCCVWCHMEDAEEPTPMRRVLVPVDMSEGSEQAVRVAVCLARRLEASLHLLHAFPPPLPGDTLTWDEATLDSCGVPQDTLDAYRASTQEQFDAFVAAHTPDDVPTTSEFVEDAPIDAVLARQAEFELTVMGTQGRGKISAALLGSVTQGVLHRCTRSVLAVPHSADLQQRGEQVVDSFHVTA